MQVIDLSPSGAVAWEGAVSVEALPDGSRTAWRIPHDRAELFAPLPGQAGLLDVRAGLYMQQRCRAGCPPDFARAMHAI